jgi:hypothetical protein
MGVQVVPDSAWLDILAALIAPTAPLDGAKLHLNQNNIVPTTGMALAALTEADIHGYVAATVVWGAVHTDPTYGPVVDGGASVFLTTTPVAGANTIYGAYLTNGAGDKLLAAVKLDAPVVLNAVGQGVVVVPQYGPRAAWMMI